jgi:hypothetical protein
MRLHSKWRLWLHFGLFGVDKTIRNGTKYSFVDIRQSQTDSLTVHGFESNNPQ